MALITNSLADPVVSFSDDLCTVADSVFRIGSDGDVQRLPPVHREAMRLSNPREAEEQRGKEKYTDERTPSEKPAGSVLSPPVSASAKDEKDELRRGDRTLYTYYLGSVKRSLLVLSLFLIILSSVSDRTPGEILICGKALGIC